MGKGAFKVSSVHGSLNVQKEINTGRRQYRVGNKGKVKYPPSRRSFNTGVNSPEPTPPKKEVEE